MHKRHLDIQHPLPAGRQGNPRQRVFPNLAKSIEIPYVKIDRPEPERRNHFKIPVLAALVIFLLIVGFFGLNLARFKQRAETAAPIVHDNFKEGVAALLRFDLGSAKDYFQAASGELSDLTANSPLKTVPAILKNLFQISQTAVAFSEDLQNLEANGLAMIVGKKGAMVIKLLHDIQDRLAQISGLSSELKVQAAGAGYNVDAETGDVSSKFPEADRFLTAVLAWLEAPKKQRLLIFFQNPSEIRPGGGFIGSYGNITLFQGNLLDLEVRDIYDPDGQLKAKIIPPKPLQGITGVWGARDANWFFDFPLSAEKTIDFLELSKIYSEKGIKFSGAVAVNVELIKDVLEIIGPIELPEYQLTLTPDNFLEEVQREVETGDDKSRGEPKKILKVLTPILFERLGNLNEDQKSRLLDKLTARFANKDIMVYFRDSTIENYLQTLGAAGEVARLPDDFVGGYLAVANANVAGGKSDAFIDQQITLESKIDSTGLVKNHLVVRRSHGGENEKDWWYRSTNHNYLQIFTEPGTKLISMSGDTKKVIKPLVNYNAGNYEPDSDLVAVERKGGLAFGKENFSAWLDVKAGASKDLVVDYAGSQHLKLGNLAYQFIFDKQSGVRGGLEYAIEAPDGYHWKESQSRTFKYANENPPARIVLNLTLEEDPR
ncbi:MAG: hypothetical protein UY12_C0027G0006 [Parcubacteria group bacterium GW2011_GWA2_47_8b]|nr:MAG: hypothetical protein UY12_C0027G0006 [Parcubacteria group bacterium GW2011_GWA2_47_8b]